MKQKKKKPVNNKFNFDDDCILGLSDSDRQKMKEEQPKKNTAKKNVSKNVKKKKAPAVKKKIVKFFIILLIWVGAGCFLCLSPTFNIQEIKVENNEVIPADTIVSLSKIKLYENIFTMHKGTAIKKILKNPYIDSVEIKRNLPNKVTIKIQERTEKYKVEFAEGKYAVLDGQGYILRITNDNVNLPLIVGLNTEMKDMIDIKDNQTRVNSEDLKKIEIVSNIMNISENNEVASYISKIDITNIGQVDVEFASENKVAHLGPCTYLDTRILFMKVILEDEKGNAGEMFINGNLSEDDVFFRETVK